jgi:hypothetical protein
MNIEYDYELQREYAIEYYADDIEARTVDYRIEYDEDPDKDDIIDEVILANFDAIDNKISLDIESEARERDWEIANDK